MPHSPSSSPTIHTAINGQDLIVQQPSGQAQQLMLLCHGYGADATDLLPLGQVLATKFPHALIVSLQAPQQGEHGFGRQWYSLLNVQEGNGPNSRVARIGAVLPDFALRVAAWQHQASLGPQATLLLGFSQGASMALEFAHHAPTVGVGRVVALSGRFAALPDKAVPDLTVHMVHGKADDVIPYGFCMQGAEHLVAIGADVTADVLPFMGHEINDQVLQLVLERLQTYVPKRVWDAALLEDPQHQTRH